MLLKRLATGMQKSLLMMMLEKRPGGTGLVGSIFHLSNRASLDPQQNFIMGNVFLMPALADSI